MTRQKDEVDEIIRFQAEFISLVEKSRLDPLIIVELIANSVATLIYENAPDVSQLKLASITGLEIESHLQSLRAQSRGI